MSFGGIKAPIFFFRGKLGKKTHQTPMFSVLQLNFFYLNVTKLFDLMIHILLFTEKTYPDTKHSHDIWHAAKNLGKKIFKVNMHAICNQ